MPRLVPTMLGLYKKDLDIVFFFLEIEVCINSDNKEQSYFPVGLKKVYQSGSEYKKGKCSMYDYGKEGCER